MLFFISREDVCGLCGIIMIYRRWRSRRLAVILTISPASSARCVVTRCHLVLVEHELSFSATYTRTRLFSETPCVSLPHLPTIVDRLAPERQGRQPQKRHGKKIEVVPCCMRSVEIADFHTVRCLCRIYMRAVACSTSAGLPSFNVT